MVEDFTQQRIGAASRIGRILTAILLAVGLLTGRPVSAQQRPTIDLTKMSLEELLTIKIITVGKKEQSIANTAAAVYVITSDDIRRSRVLSIPDVLRQVPGIQVARETTGEWAISIRGFNDRHANKLLVLMDGRTLYSPVYTGVEWDLQDTLIEDIDRIEVIRGPGAAVWGANAMNGVINIITKEAKDTQGVLVTYHVGAFDNGTVAARYGGSLGENVQYRLFSKFFSRPNLTDMAGDTPPGGWDALRHGARLDWSPTERDRVTTSAEWSGSNVREVDFEITSLTSPFESVVEEHDKTTTAFLLTRWSHTISDSSSFEVKAFYDRTHQYDGQGHDKAETVETADLDFQHRFSPWQNHDFVWGGGFRQVGDRVDPAIDSWFSPARRTAHTYNGFLQDEIGLLDDRVMITAGSKFEWNSFSKAEVLPSLRVLWMATPSNSFWTAASRAVRLPSRNEVDQFSIESISLNDDDDVSYELLVATPGFKPERLMAYEAGYRFLPTRRLSFDVATFYNVYDDLQTIETADAYTAVTPIAGIVTPLARGNNAFGTVYGAEVVGFWTVSDALQLSGGYTRLHSRFDVRASSNDGNVGAFAEANAKNLFHLRSYASIPFGIELNTQLRFVGRIQGEDVPAYIDGNVHVSRAVATRLRLGLTVDNVLHHRHAEWAYGDGLVESRSVRAGIEWRF